MIIYRLMTWKKHKFRDINEVLAYATFDAAIDGLIIGLTVALLLIWLKLL